MKTGRPLEWTTAKRAALRRMIDEGRSGEEIAASLGVTKIAVYSQVHDLDLRIRKTRPGRVADYMLRYQVSRCAVEAMGVALLDRMGEEARAFMLRRCERDRCEQQRRRRAASLSKKKHVLPEGDRNVARMLELAAISA